MSALRRLLLELPRRSISQVLGTYLVGAWVAYEVVLDLTQGIGLPDWVPFLAAMLLLAGLPLVTATAAVQSRLATRRAAVQPQEDMDLPGPDGVAAVAPEPGGLARHLTWSRAGAAGGLGFVILTGASSAYLGMRALGVGPAASLLSRRALSAGDPLVLADFRPLGADSVLATVVTEALRVELQESKAFRLADRAGLRPTLDLMRRPPGAPLDPETAREAAQRLGLKGVVTGDVGRAGRSYLLTAHVVTADSGRTLASFHEAAQDSTKLVRAIEKLAHAMRSRIGESLRTVRASPPLTQVTTSSLPALRKWTEARRLYQSGDDDRHPVELLDEAIELDSGFAMAWQTLAIIHYNDDRRAAALGATRHALALEQRLTESERTAVRWIHATLIGDLQTAEAEVLGLPGPGKWTNLSDLAWNRGDWANAEEYARRSIRDSQESGSPPQWVQYFNLVVALLDQGRTAEARSAVKGSPFAGTPVGARLLFYVDFVEGRYRDAAARVVGTPWDEFRSQLVLGRVQEADAALLRRSAGAGADALAEAYVALGHYLVLGDSSRLGTVEAFVRKVEVPEWNDHLLIEMGVALAVAGRTDAARVARSTYEARVPPEIRWRDAHLLDALDAFVHLSAARNEQAIAALYRARDATPFTAPMDALLGIAYDRLDRPDSAAAAFERYLGTPWSLRAGNYDMILTDPMLLVPIHERLAELYERTGHPAAAGRHALRVAEIWSQADAVLQPRVAAMERLRERVARPTREAAGAGR